MITQTLPCPLRKTTHESEDKLGTHATSYKAPTSPHEGARMLACFTHITQAHDCSLVRMHTHAHLYTQSTLTRITGHIVLTHTHR